MSFADAKAQVVAALEQVGPPVYPFEPGLGQGVTRPSGITVSTAGLGATDWRLVVRLYVSTSSDVEASDDALAVLLEDSDEALDSIAAPRSDWVVSWVQGLDCLVASTTLQFGRDDF